MENNNQGKLRKAIIAILVLLILVAVALGVSYLYRHMKDADNSKTSVPQSLISEQQTDEDNQNNTNDNNLSERPALKIRTVVLIYIKTIMSLQMIILQLQMEMLQVIIKKHLILN